MRPDLDPLYSIFEQHLFNALVEGESTDEFLVRVVTDYIGRLVANGTVIAHEHMGSIEADLHEEVLEMCRKKTYGHFNLAEYRKAKGIAASSTESAPGQAAPVQKTKARRGSRAC